MWEKRRIPRFATQAHVRISGVMEGENLLKDLSVTGCCVECTTAPDIVPGTEFQLEIMPEKASGVESFTLTVTAQWIRTMDYCKAIGFSIVSSPKGKWFQRYVDYLAYKQSRE